MIDTLRPIAIFAKTIDHGSFRGAAEELHLSPSVVSHHISQLEEKLGVALIYRSTRKLTLTREGEILLASVRDLLTGVEASLDTLSGHSSEPSGELRLALPSVLAQSHLIREIAAFHAKYPKIKLHLDFSDERKNLINDGYDLAIRMTPHRERAPNRKRLFQVNRCLVASPEYLSDTPKIEHPDDLNAHQSIQFSPTVRLKTSLTHEGHASVSISPMTTISTNDAIAAYRLACANAGIAMIPDFLAEKDINEGKICAILPQWQLAPLEVYAEWPTNAPKDGISRLLVSELSEEMAPQPSSLGSEQD